MAAALAGGAAAIAAGEGGRRRIEVRAQKFEFTPKEIRLKKGEPVTFVLRAEDFPHGFSLPDFKLRRDFVPGMTVEFDFAADKTGKFHFLCDNFCGEGHDTMSGWLFVS
jgi:cytochrome c oxidase subunit 2